MADLHRYVRTPANGGNDANGGTSWEDAWASNQHGADEMNPSGYDNAILHSAAGSFGEQVDVDTYAGTDDDNRIIYDGDVENESGDGDTRPIVDGGDTRQFGFNIVAKSWITIQDFGVKNQYQAATNTAGIHAEWGGSFDTEGINVSRCLVHDITGRYVLGIHFYACYNIKVINSIIYDMHLTIDSGYAVGLYLFATGGEVYNDTIFHTYYDGGLTPVEWHGGFVAFGHTSIPSGYKYLYMKNNIIHDCYERQICLPPEASKYTDGIVIDYNNWYKDGQLRCGLWLSTECPTLSDWQTASGQDANSQNTDPLYVDEGGRDFHIEDTNSPCYNNGTDVGVDDDYDGDDRTVKAERDIGADLILAVFSKLVSDSGSGVEVTGILAKIPVFDSGLGLEVANVLGKVSILDLGLALEVIRTSRKIPLIYLKVFTDKYIRSVLKGDN